MASLSGDEQKLESLVMMTARLPWGQVPDWAKLEIATLRRKIHCDTNNVPIPPGHPLADAWHTGAKSHHRRVRSQLLKSCPWLKQQPDSKRQ